MKNSKTAILLVAVVLLAASALWAANNPAPKASSTPSPKIYSMTGTVSSFTSTSLVLSRTAKGKKSETNFVLTPETRQEAQLAQGAEVTVHYRMENKERVATEIEAPHAKGGEKAEKAETHPKK